MAPRWFRRSGAHPRPEVASGPRRPPDAAPVVRSRALARFVAIAGARVAAEVVDLGPAVGSNITFLGERLDCRIHVEDLYADLDRHRDLPEFVAGRFAHAPGTIDAVLCWDVFDYLDGAAAGVLATQLTRMLRPGGVVLAFFGGSGAREPGYTRYVIQDETHLRYERCPGARDREPARVNRDILALFGGLRVADSVMLPSGVREFVFTKPVEPAS